jgi:hypothetical protein
LNGLGQLNGDKPLGREEIVLSALVDDADIAGGLSFRIGKGNVNLVALE